MKRNNRILTYISAVLLLGHLGMGSSAVASDAPAGGSYLDMGQAVVQIPASDCGLRNLAVSYQLEYSDPSKAAYLNANKPKVQSVVFGALSDYFATHETYTFQSVRDVLDAEIREAFGKDVVAAVIITQVVQFGQ